MTDPYAARPTRRKRHSAALTDGVDRAPARAMLKGIGLDDEALARPLVGIATTWIETMPCNWNQRELARHVRRGILEAGGTPVEFNTIAVSDGVSMGTEGMRASLVSRETIADSIELVVRGHLLDGLVCLVGCDKTIPAAVMALARLDVPGLVLYNGSIAPGRFRDRDVTIQDVFEAVGAAAAGKMSHEDVHELEGAACPGAGACGGQFTANTMAMVVDFLGIGPAGLNGVPATDPAKRGRRVRGRQDRDAARPRRRAPDADPDPGRARERGRRGRRHRRLDERRPPPARDRARARDPAHDRRVRRDRRRARRSSPTSSRAAASSPPTCTRPAASRSSRASSLKRGLVHGDARTVDGRTLAEIAAAAVETPGQEVVVPIERPLKETGGLAILRGNLAPEGCVVKLAGHERLLHRGPARVFDSEEECFAAVKARTIEPGDVVVIRYEGPPAGPACARCCT